MIDPETSWFEIARIYTKTSKEAQLIFDSTWLARYPRPKEVGFDNGREFKHLFTVRDSIIYTKKFKIPNRNLRIAGNLSMCLFLGALI